MGRTTRKPATPDAAECDGFAMCAAGSELGWTAINPCSGCVAIATDQTSERVSPGESRSADVAQLVTADEFDALLLQVRLARGNGPTSSR